MKHNLTVIRGGIKIPEAGNGHTFISGYATNTRLMGVIGLELTWDVLRNSHIEKLHQIFYIDCEEYGIESYSESYGDTPLEILQERIRLYSSLGGDIVPVTEKEARFLIQTHSFINTKYNQQMAEGRDKYAFLMKPAQILTLEEYISLYERICGDTYLPYYVINYFIMRCISGDACGAAWLLDSFSFRMNETVSPSFLPDMSDCELFMDSKPATLCRNNIVAVGEANDNSYFCESLIEFKNQYHVITSMIKLNESSTRVLCAEKKSDFHITSIEAAMLISRSEFITVYNVPEDNESFLDSFAMFVSSYTETIYENGKLYVDFNDTNDHVGESVYLINNDVHVIYYLTDYGQILIMGYSFDAVQDAEFRLFLALMPFTLTSTMKYEFKEPVLYEFIQSDFADFDEFVDYLGGHTDPEE
jgi:hypothetical protein